MHQPFDSYIKGYSHYYYMNQMTRDEILEMLRCMPSVDTRTKLSNILSDMDCKEAALEVAKEKYKERARQYRLEHRDKINEYTNNYLKDKYKNDPEYREKVRILKHKSDERKRQAKREHAGIASHSIDIQA